MFQVLSLMCRCEGFRMCRFAPRAVALPLVAVLAAFQSVATEPSSPSPVIPSRQVHLDFHTSEVIPGVGNRFNKSQW